MADEWNLLLRIADVAVSLAVLVAIVAGFVRGDILARRSLAEIVTATVREILRELNRP